MTASNATTKTKALPKKTMTKNTPAKELAKEAVLHPVTPFLASVPDASVATRYVGRKFHIGPRKTMTDMEVFDYCYNNNRNLLIEGPTGPGKTMATRAWAALRGKRVARIPSNNGIESSQLFGKFNPSAQGNFVWVDGPVTHVFRNGGVILWNEINFTPERVGSIMFGALDDQREIVLLDHDGETIRAHRGSLHNCWCKESDDVCDERRVLIVADQNPDYAGTRDLNAALRNRFAIQLSWDYDPEVEKRLIHSPSLLSMAQRIRAQAETAGIDTPISTNMLMEFEQIARDISVTFATMNFVNHFKAEEQDPIRLVCETHSDNIASDYAPVVVADQSDDDGDDLVPDNQHPGNSGADDDDAAALAQWVFAADD